MNPTKFIVKRFNVDPRYSNSVPTGWTGLVFEALEQIKQVCSEIKLLQVKEKFAGLRIYFTLPNDCQKDVEESVNSIIRKAEEESEKTCQHCGIEGKVEQIGNWLMTLCKFCCKEELRKRELRGY